MSMSTNVTTLEEARTVIEAQAAQIATLAAQAEAQRLALDPDQQAVVDAAVREIKECPERVCAALFRSSVEMLSSPRLPPEMRVAAAEQTMARIQMMRTALGDMGRVK